MLLRRIFILIIAVIVGSWIVSPPLMLASQDEVIIAADPAGQDSRVPEPYIPRGQGENCVEDTDFMRREHMDMLKHQRDETMLKGIRREQYSLRECINCHAVTGPDELPVTATNPDHFCRSCHDYAAVKIDCFQCHASRPDIEITNDVAARSALGGAG